MNHNRNMKLPNFSPVLKFISAKKWWLVILVLVALGGFFYVKQQNAKKVVLQFGQPIRQDITQTLQASGVVDAKDKALLRFTAGGKLVYLGAKEGDTVKKWQTIATIDARDLQKRLEKSLNTYSQQRNSWDQTVDDTKDRTLATKENRTVNTNQLTLNNVVADVELASIGISNATMTSPIAGVLVSAPTNLSGVTLSPTDTFVIVNPSTLIFRAEVDEADISQVKVGQKVTLSLDAYQDKTIETYVSRIGYLALETSSGTAFIVEMPIPAENALDTYRLGMNGDSNIILTTKPNVLTVPLAATKERDAKFFVDVKTGPNEAVEREIQVGTQTDTLIEVTSGLIETDQIVLPE